MKSGPVHFALRELRDAFGQPRNLAGLAIVGLLVGFAGPFGSADTLSLFPRLAYWLAMIGVTYAIGVFFAGIALAALRPLQLGPVWRILVVSVLTSVPIFVAVIAINAAFLGVPLPLGAKLVGSWLSILVIALGVVVLHFLSAHRPRPDASEGAARTEAPPPLLERLPADLRGPLVRLSMQDHYVEVETVRGKTLVLLRMSDAIKETAGTDGLQIHRSHWVARDQIARVDRSGGKISVETRTGARLPVSRGYLPALREAGLVA